MPPRQRTTFKNKKPTTTYSYVEDRPMSASERLDTFIRNNPAGDNRNTQQSTIQEVVADMPQKFKNSTFKNFTGNDYSHMTQGQKMIFDFYNDRNKYQRDMNNLRTSSPEMRQAYAQRFPVSNFAMEKLPSIVGAMAGIPLSLFQSGFDKVKQGGQYVKENIGSALSSGIDNTMKFAESGLDTGAQIVGDLANTTAQMGGDVADRGGELLQDLTDKGTNIFEQATAPNVEDLSFTVQNRPTGPRENTVNPLEKLLIDSGSVDTAGVERLFKLPRNFPGDFNNQYFTDIPDDSLRDNYLVRNPQSPYFANSQQPGTGLYGMNLNQGGLASLNNKDYMQLMGASNFGF